MGISKHANFRAKTAVNPRKMRHPQEIYSNEGLDAVLHSGLDYKKSLVLRYGFKFGKDKRKCGIASLVLAPTLLFTASLFLDFFTFQMPKNRRTNNREHQNQLCMPRFC